MNDISLANNAFILDEPFNLGLQITSWIDT